MEIKKKYKGKNGIARDVYKLWYEFRWVFCPAMKEPVLQFLDTLLFPFHISHKFTNLWVEACRASPYFFGHVLVIVFWTGVIYGLQGL